HASRTAAVSGRASWPTFTTQVRPEPSFTRYFVEKPPVSTFTKVTRDRSGFIAAPPGPRNKSREEMLPGSLHRTRVAFAGICLSFLSGLSDFFCAKTLEELRIIRLI